MALVGDTSDLDELVYSGCPVLPEKDSYSVRTPYGVVQSDFRGGLSKQQVMYFNDPYLVNVTYVALDQFKISFLEDFFLRQAGQKFIATLLIGGNLEQFVVQYIGQPQFSQTGFNGSFSVTYEVVPSVDQCYQQFIRDYGPCMGNFVTQGFPLIDAGIRALP